VSSIILFMMVIKMVGRVKKWEINGFYKMRKMRNRAIKFLKGDGEEKNASYKNVLVGSTS